MCNLSLEIQSVRNMWNLKGHFWYSALSSYERNCLMTTIFFINRNNNKNKYYLEHKKILKIGYLLRLTREETNTELRIISEILISDR